MHAGKSLPCSRTETGLPLFTMRQYTVILERETDGRYSVWVPDLTGCTSMGESAEEALVNIREAIVCHIEGLRADGLPIPDARTLAVGVSVEAA